MAALLPHAEDTPDVKPVHARVRMPRPIHSLIAILTPGRRSIQRYSLPALALGAALAATTAAPASATMFHVQGVTVTRAGSLNIFMTAACAPTHDRYRLTATVSQRGRHHTVNEVTVGTDQLGVCTDPPSVFPFWQNGLCGSAFPPCAIGSGFHPGRATVQWSGKSFGDAVPDPLPPVEKAGSTTVVIKCERVARGPGLRATADAGSVLTDRCRPSSGPRRG
jgi:hypothetical protein